MQGGTSEGASRVAVERPTGQLPSTPSPSVDEDDSGEHDVPDFPSAWRVNIRVAQLLGLFPLRRLRGPGPGPGPPMYRWRLSRGSQAATLFSFTTCFLCVYNFVIIFSFMGQGVKVIMALLTKVTLILFAASGMPCLVGAVYTGRRMERFTNSLLLLVKELRPVHEQVWPPGWALRGLIVPLAMLVLDVTRESFHMPSISLMALAVALAYVVPMTTESQYSFLCSVLGLGFGRLVGRVRGLQASPHSPASRELDAVRRAHEQLVALTACLHGLLGPPLLVTAFACQVSLLTSSYTLASYALDGNFQLRERRADIVDLIFFAMRLSGLCMSAETIRSEANALVELSLRVDPANWSPRAREKWSLFLTQLEFIKPSFQAGGLLQIGSGMIASVCGTTLSYLLVLLQFDSY